MYGKILKLTSILVILVFLFPVHVAQSGPPAPPPTLATLEPGGFRTIERDLDINVVFIGFDPPAVDSAAFLGALPAGYRTILRYPDQ